jgi:hypothetical protein
MDFLDPRKRRHHQIRLFIGYCLMTVAVALGAIVLVYGAYGYSLNTKNGQIIQNGLLFVDSKPGGADIYLNNKLQSSTTSARFVLQASKYTLDIKKSGYRSWQRTFELDEHAISRYVYPFLFPEKLSPATLKLYGDKPGLITQSPDRHWILVQSTPLTSGAITFDQYDTGNLKQPAVSLSFPASVLTRINSPGSKLTEVEWSTDNNHLLLQHTYVGGSEFVVLDRNSPEKSFNVNQLFKINPSQVALRNKKIDQLYIYNQSKQELQLGDTGKAVLAKPFLTHVLAFKSNGNNLLTYVTANKMPVGKAQARIWDNAKTYPLSIFSAGDIYLIDAAQFQGHWYYIAGSNTAPRINLYKDPLDNLRDASISRALPFLSFNITGATKVSFSANARFIGVQAAQKIGVYDMEVKQRYQYTDEQSFTPPLAWMDGHRWLGNSNGSIMVIDYDGTNRQLLVPSVDPKGGYFSRDFNQLYVLAPIGPADPSVVLESVDMRAGVDLPKP